MHMKIVNYNNYKKKKVVEPSKINNKEIIERINLKINAYKIEEIFNILMKIEFYLILKHLSC